MTTPIKRSDGGDDAPSRADTGGSLPEFGEGEYMFRTLMDLGPLRAMPMGGERAVDWPEIASFAQVCGPFAGWELQLLREMALAFMDGVKLGRDPMGRAPMGG